MEAGEDIARPATVHERRERVTNGYRELLADDAREAFDESIALARTVYRFVEDHNFYIDHRYMTIFWNKVRDFGALLADYQFLDDAEDVFLLRHDEVRGALEELRLTWSSGGAGRSPRACALASARRASEDDLRSYALLVATSGSWPRAGRHHGAVHDHSVGHHS